VSSLILLLGMVKSILNRVPSENFSVVSINAPAEDMSLVLNLKICFLLESFVSILASSESGNLSTFRRSFMAKAFLCLRFKGSGFPFRLFSVRHSIFIIRYSAVHWFWVRWVYLGLLGYGFRVQGCLSPDFQFDIRYLLFDILRFMSVLGSGFRGSAFRVQGSKIKKLTSLFGRQMLSSLFS